MRFLTAAIVMIGGLAQMPAEAGLPVAQTADVSSPAPGAEAQAATHATRGVVKSIDSTTLVVSRPKNRGDITFRVSPTTHRDGTIFVGAPVAVRYREEGKTHVATAIALQKPTR